MFHTLANQFLYAKNPLIQRIDKLDVNIPIWFIYGSDSWIDKTGQKIKELRADEAYVSVEVIFEFQIL